MNTGGFMVSSRGLGITVAASTVWQILKNADFSPVPCHDGPGWAESLWSQAHGILALDFFTTAVLNGTKVCPCPGCHRDSTRRVRILGATGASGPVVRAAAGQETADGPGRYRDEPEVRPA